MDTSNTRANLRNNAKEDQLRYRQLWLIDIVDSKLDAGHSLREENLYLWNQDREPPCFGAAKLYLAIQSDMTLR